MNSFLKNVLKTIKKYNLIKTKDTEMVGVSASAHGEARLPSFV